VLDNETLLADFAGSYFSKTKCALDLQALDEPLDAAELINMLQDQPLVRTGGLRCFYLDQTLAQGTCYIEGERYVFGAACKEAVITLCDNDALSFNALQGAVQHPEFVRQLTEWVNGGYWYFED
jgi:50S ribosomal protein L16 3-hydroxylase